MRLWIQRSFLLRVSFSIEDEKGESGAHFPIIFSHLSLFLFPLFLLLFQDLGGKGTRYLSFRVGIRSYHTFDAYSHFLPLLSFFVSFQDFFDFSLFPRLEWERESNNLVGKEFIHLPVDFICMGNDKMIKNSRSGAELLK